VYVATGYSGNGITFGTLAGMIVSDLLNGPAVSDLRRVPVSATR
jgi:glycine/D-amino acid oxidase-like deaminating enzyme